MKHRLHLYDGSITEWFDRGELSLMVKKYEGRIVTIGTENEDIEDVHPA